ncbi:MAG: hypothetical protein RLY97_360 [Pseudomonadota bacterium]
MRQFSAAKCAIMALLTLAPTMVKAAETPCFTPAEFTAMATYALPSLITGVAQKCSVTLPATSFLRSSGADLATRYALAKTAAWPATKTAFVRVILSAKPEMAELAKSLPEEMQQQMVDTALGTIISEKLPADRCTSVDRLVQLLSPLPAENTAELIGLAVGLGNKATGGKPSKLPICGA